MEQVVYVDEQGHVIELFVAAGTPWQWADLTQLTGAPLASGSASDWLRVASRCYQTSGLCG